MKSFFYILLISTLLIFSCNENKTYSDEVAMKHFIIQEKWDQTYKEYFYLKDFYYSIMAERDKPIFTTGDSLIKSNIKYAESCSRKSGEYTLVMYSDFIHRIYQTSLKEYYSNRIKNAYSDSTIKYIPIYRERYIKSNSLEDSLNLLYFSVFLENDLMKTLVMQISYSWCFRNHFNVFPSKYSYYVGDTVTISGCKESTLFLLITRDLKLFNKNTKIINLKTNEEVNYNIDFAGPIVTLQFVPDKSGDYSIYSEIQDKSYEDTYHYAVIQDTIHIK